MHFQRGYLGYRKQGKLIENSTQWGKHLWGFSCNEKLLRIVIIRFQINVILKYNRSYRRRNIYGNKLPKRVKYFEMTNFKNILRKNIVILII